MANLLAQGSEWLEAQRHAHCTLTVTYERGDDSCEWAVTIGRSEFEQGDQYGVIHRTESRDFLGLAAELVFDGDETLPKAGDRIVETVGEKAYVYEVMSFGDEPPYRYSDQNRKTLRVHTKHVSTNTIGGPL